MSRKSSPMFVLSTLLLIPSALLAQSNTGARTGPRVRPKTGHELVAPFWTVEAGWSTELEVRNNLGQDDLVVTPVLRTFDGVEVQLAPVTIPSDQVRSVNLADAIQSANPKLSGGVNYSFGSLALRYNSISTQNVYAAVVVHHEGYPINFHFDAYPVDSNFASGSSETIWWLPIPTSDGYLVVSNFSSRAVTAEQVVTGSKSSRGQQSFSVGAHETRRFSIRELKQTLGIEGNVGGIKVAFDSDAGSVYVSNVLFDEFSGFSAIMKVFNRDTSAKVERITLMAPLVGLRVPDAMLGYPAETVLQPQLFVRNASSSALASSILVNWKSSTSTGKVSLNIPPLAPEETRVVDLGAMQQNGALPPNANWASVGIAYDGWPGDLVPVAASYDPSSRYGVQSPFSSDLSFMWKGGMWHVDGTHNILITTGNAGQKPAQVAVTLFYGQNAVYELPVKQLAPEAQTWVDIGELIRNGIPDKNRRIMPADTMSGSYEIRDLNDSSIGYLFEGKIISDKKFGHATYGCAACCGFDDAYLAPDPIFGPIGGYGSFGVWATNSCTGVATDKSGLAYNWASSVPPVGTVDASGNTTWISLGTTNLTSSINLRSPIGINNCHVATFPMGAPGNVISVTQTPASLNMSSGDTGKTISVTISPNGATGTLVFATALVVNPNSAPPQASFSVAGSNSASGTASYPISSNGPTPPSPSSGVFTANACVSGACAPTTTANIPPQVLIQVLYGEGHGQAISGDLVTQPAIGSSIKNRFGKSEFPGGAAATYQGVVTSNHYDGITTSITTGVDPELGVAVALFTGAQGDTVAGSPCLFSPDHTGWTAIQAALNSGTTTVPTVAHDPQCYSSNRQLVYKSSIGNNVNGSGAPAFIFERQRANSSDPAVIQIP